MPSAGNKVWFLGVLQGYITHQLIPQAFDRGSEHLGSK